jgi:hypothetical protein
MAARFRDILTDLYTALRAAHAVYNLSTVNSTPRVRWADGAMDPETTPLVLLGGLAARTSYSQAAMGQYDNKYRMEWWGFVSAPDLSPEARVLAALDLADDVINALQVAHRTSSYTTLYQMTELIVSLEDVFGDGDDVPPGFGVAWGVIDITATDTAGI